MTLLPRVLSCLVPRELGLRARSYGGPRLSLQGGGDRTIQDAVVGRGTLRLSRYSPGA